MWNYLIHHCSLVCRSCVYLNINKYTFPGVVSLRPNVTQASLCLHLWFSLHHSSSPHSDSVELLRCNISCSFHTTSIMSTEKSRLFCNSTHWLDDRIWISGRLKKKGEREYSAAGEAPELLSSRVLNKSQLIESETNWSPTRLRGLAERCPTLPAANYHIKKPTHCHSPALSLLLLFINAVHYWVCM